MEGKSSDQSIIQDGGVSEEFNDTVAKKEAIDIMDAEAPRRIFSNIYDRWDILRPEIEEFVDQDNFEKTENDRGLVISDVQVVDQKMVKLEDDQTEENLNIDYFVGASLNFKTLANDLSYYSGLIFRTQSVDDETREKIQRLNQLADQAKVLREFSHTASSSDYKSIALNSLNKSTKDFPKGTDLEEAAYNGLTEEIDGILQGWIDTPDFTIYTDRLSGELKDSLDKFLQYRDLAGQPFPSGIGGKALDKLFPEDLKETDEYKSFRYFYNLRYLI